MFVKVAHGSKRNDLTQLEPQYIRGNNGYQDGIGVNLTVDANIAVGYAKDTGSVYLVDLDISHFLIVSDKEKLNAGQAEILKMHLATLPKQDQYRLATDLCGKLSQTFDNDVDAEVFYKTQRKTYKEMRLTVDRLKPEIDYADDGRMMIQYANETFDSLTDVDTKRLHYCLNLFDNSIATSLLKTISSGLVLERENGKHNYLSFRNSESVTDRLDQQFLSKPNAINVIQRACDRSLSTHASLDNNSYGEPAFR